MKRLVFLLVLVAVIAACPDKVEAGRDMMRGASDMERKNTEGQVQVKE